MTDFIRSLFESALKTNPNLEFAVVTGCLRITKESIFTGLNNLKMVSILDIGYSEQFGFTQKEVDSMLQSYNITGRQEEVKAWYDGYMFGKTEVYNPWSILMYVDSLCQDKDTEPKPYWANTSSNSIIRELIEHADNTVKQEMETLIDGGTIEKPVHEEVTYEDIYNSADNLWNFLFFTGYLKKVEQRLEDVTTYLTLGIPNLEARYIYQNTILDWFNTRIRQKEFTRLYKALQQKDTLRMEKEISQNLMETISFYDYREDYYHGFLGGLLKMMEGYTVKSNRESGRGRSDLLLLSAPYDGIAIIVEIKVSDTYAQLEEKALSALGQIEEKQYDAELRLEGYHTFIKYGISFYKKLCKVVCN
ncbi:MULTISPECIES: AAA family ATPase [Eisenbergiella]|uniref:PD-(D/E)XK nuclease domain-containing protein n=1 Tax=Eisenbergiella porci TaxID=2652274 RepID=UPI002ED43F39